ncbi:phosphoribosyltransferase [Sulfurimonas marina]|uniref:Phosphoribosyltransferase n=1 Tax=Sulfurimonas marina TaxID=2590551 RepID=A0A7M1AWT2_9BACT|nr:phosphoribosyltransferase [Sulfurimonas marina]QOP41923.1 phosphoribosyltransferase [Sulfurimonas marina]
MKQYKEILQNRQDAAKKLTEVIPMDKLKDEQWELIAVSHGGLELSTHIKGRLKNRIDILFLEPIMAPNNPECEVARVSETEEIVIQENLIESFEIKLDYVYGEAHRKHEEGILSNIYKFRKGRPFASMKDKVVLLIDEGSETGTKFMTALKTVLAQSPKAVYIAVPVIPSDVLETLEVFVDDIFFLHDIDDYVETSLYYKKLDKIDDETVEKILEENK